MELLELSFLPGSRPNSPLKNSIAPPNLSVSASRDSGEKNLNKDNKDLSNVDADARTDNSIAFYRSQKRAYLANSLSQDA